MELEERCQEKVREFEEAQMRAETQCEKLKIEKAQVRKSEKRAESLRHELETSRSEW